MLKKIYVQSGILSTITILAIGCVSHVPTETAPITSSSLTFSSTAPSLPAELEPVGSQTTDYDIALAAPYLGDNQIRNLDRSA